MSYSASFAAPFFLPLALAGAFYLSSASPLLLAVRALRSPAGLAAFAALGVDSGYFSPSVFLALSSGFSGLYSEPRSSTMAISAPSPRRGPRRRIRVYPPGRVA